MLYISLPEERTRALSFYLAMEEYVARYKEEPECFFMWQVEPSVIFGRNQLIEKEVNLEYCRKHGIRTYRRKSGGGCVYADMKNIMFSYITKEENVSFTFTRYIQMVVDVLRKLGLDAVASGRNDIMIGDRKVSGNAFYHLKGCSIVHGTMLYDTNMAHMVGSITPDDVKLQSKGVESVRQHITLLKDYLQMDIETFKQFVKDNLCDGVMMLDENDVAGIEELEKEYLSPEFIYGHNPKSVLTRNKRLEGVGEFEVRLELKNKIIKAINLMGDYFLVGDLDGRIVSSLTGVPYTREAISAALPERVDDIILHLQKEDLINIIID